MTDSFNSAPLSSRSVVCQSAPSAELTTSQRGQVEVGQNLKYMQPAWNITLYIFKSEKLQLRLTTPAPVRPAGTL